MTIKTPLFLFYKGGRQKLIFSNFFYFSQKAEYGLALKVEEIFFNSNRSQTKIKMDEMEIEETKSQVSSEGLIVFSLLVNFNKKVKFLPNCKRLI